MDAKLYGRTDSWTNVQMDRRTDLSKSGTHRNSTFSGSEKPRMLFFLLINVKMPTIVGIFTFMSRENFSSAELSMKLFL